MNKRNVVIGIIVAALIAVVGINLYSESSPLDSSTTINIPPGEIIMTSSNKWSICYNTEKDNRISNNYYELSKKQYQELLNKSLIAEEENGWGTTIEEIVLVVKETRSIEGNYSTYNKTGSTNWYTVKSIKEVKE